MNPFVRSLFTLSVCLVGTTSAHAADPAPAFVKEAQGEWYVLAAHQNNKNLTAEKGVGSKITITADGVVWPNPEKPDAPLVSAKCVRAPASTDPKKPSDPNELISTVTGSLCPKPDAKLAARWKITPDNDVLLLLVEVAEYKGNRNGTFSGPAPSDVIFICQRNAVPAAQKPDPAADAKRFVGKWAVLGELDDANCARTRPQGNVEFTATAFFKRGTLKSDAKPGMDGTWKPVEPRAERGRIDLTFRSGIEGNQGRSPSLYTFFGDDLLMVVYPEGGWAKDALEKQDLRKPPEHFGSDGNRNMWILRRMSEAKK